MTQGILSMCEFYTTVTLAYNVQSTLLNKSESLFCTRRKSLPFVFYMGMNYVDFT